MPSANLLYYGDNLDVLIQAVRQQPESARQGVDVFGININAQLRHSHGKGRFAVVATLLGILLVLAVGPAQAAPGDLDPTFGSGGVVTTHLGVRSDSGAGGVIVQPDGKIVIAGDTSDESADRFTVARYLGDGSLDPSFGSAGAVTTAIGASADAGPLALQPDGKIVAAGGSFDGRVDRVALARYAPDGSLDPSFGEGGKVTTQLGVDSAAWGIALQADGRIVIAARVYNVAAGWEFGLARFNPDGSLDASFGSGGKVTTAFGPGIDVASGVALQPDGRIVAVGTSCDVGGAYCRFALARYGESGSLDPSFGSGGKVTTSFGSLQDIAKAIALQPDGMIVVAGTSSPGFGLARYRSDGSLDPTFGFGGKVTTPMEHWGWAYAVLLQPDGKIVAVGSSLDSHGVNHIDLARYKTDGSLDASFGRHGVVITRLGAGAVANGAALQQDGKIVVSGAALIGAHSDMALARYLADGSPRCLVPSVVGDRLARAKRLIRGSRCSLGRVSYVSLKGTEKGQVLRQRPKADALRPAGHKVDLVVSRNKSGSRTPS